MLIKTVDTLLAENLLKKKEMHHTRLSDSQLNEVFKRRSITMFVKTPIYSHVQFFSFCFSFLFIFKCVIAGVS